MFVVVCCTNTTHNARAYVRTGFVRSSTDVRACAGAERTDLVIESLLKNGRIRTYFQGGRGGITLYIRLGKACLSWDRLDGENVHIYMGPASTASSMGVTLTTLFSSTRVVKVPSAWKCDTRRGGGGYTGESPVACVTPL